MVRPWTRKREGQVAASKHTRRDSEPAESVRLDTAENAWWAQSEPDQAWTPKARAVPEPPARRDILAEHFGDNWRTEFGLEPGAGDDAEVDDPEGAPTPYTVLGVDPSATWDEIVAAHRHQVRVHHPDRLFGQSEEEKAEGEERIRVINGAYQELRIRRGV